MNTWATEPSICISIKRLSSTTFSIGSSLVNSSKSDFHDLQMHMYLLAKHHL